MADGASSSDGSHPEPSRVVITLFSDNAEAHIKWIEEHLGGKQHGELYKNDKGKVMHAMVKLYGEDIYLGDWGSDGTTTSSFSKPPSAEMGSRGSYIHINIPGEISSRVDSICETIKDEKDGKILMKPEDQFWGARFAVIRDPFGHDWGLAVWLKRSKPDGESDGGEKPAKKAKK